MKIGLEPQVQGQEVSEPVVRDSLGEALEEYVECSSYSTYQRMC